MICNAAICAKNLIPDFALTSTGNYYAPAQNVAIPVRGVDYLPWIDTGNSVVITGTRAVVGGVYPPVISTDTIAVTGHNLNGAATVRVQLYATNNATGAIVYDSTALPARSTGEIDGLCSFYKLLDAPVIFGSFKITIAGLATGAANFRRISNVYVGKKLALSHAPTADLSYQQLSAAQFAESESGGLLVKSAATLRRSIEIPLLLLGSDDRDALAIAERGSINGVWLFVPDGTSEQITEMLMIGRQAAGVSYLSRVTQSVALRLVDI